MPPPDQFSRRLAYLRRYVGNLASALEQHGLELDTTFNKPTLHPDLRTRVG